MTKHCCLASGPDLSLRSVSSFSRVDVMWWRILRENFSNFEAKKLFVYVCFMKFWRLANSSIICHQYWRLCCSKYQKYKKSHGIALILGAKYFKWMRFCWNAWMAGVSRVVGGECECLPSQFLRSTREKLLPCTKRCHEPWDGSCRFSLEILVGKTHGLIGLVGLVILVFRLTFIFTMHLVKLSSILERSMKFHKD